jgi:hypothetical protein
MLLITTFVELCVVAWRSRTRADRPHAFSGRPMIIHTCRAVPWHWEVAFRTAWSWHGMGATWAQHGMCESNKAALCKSNGKDTIQTLSRTAWYGWFSLYSQKTDPVPIVYEAGWDPGPVWTGVENLAPTGIQSPDRPARSESLYRLSYPGPEYGINFILFLGLVWQMCVRNQEGEQCVRSENAPRSSCY